MSTVTDDDTTDDRDTERHSADDSTTADTGSRHDRVAGGRIVDRIRRAPRAVAGPGSRLDRALSVGRRRRNSAIVMTALLVLATVAAVVLAVVRSNQLEVDAARTDGLRAASEASSALLSYDYRTLDTDLARADTVTTGGFAQQYRDLTNQLIRPNASTAQIVTTTQVTGSSVVSATPSGLVALLFLNQQTTGKDTPVPRIDRSRAQVTMTEVDGRWLISELKPV